MAWSTTDDLYLDDIKRFPSKSVIHFLECSGNSGSAWREESLRDTAQQAHGLVSATEWTGVPMRTILNEVGIHPGGTWLLCEGADAAAMTRSVPTEKAMDDGLLVYGQNGEALRPEQGYPMRAIWPGFEGNSNIKWLRRIEVGNQPWQTREETSKYTDLLADGIARQFTFVMEAKSVITLPSGGQTISAQGFWEIQGIAWSGRGKIERVEISTRWRSHLGRRGTAGTGPAGLPDAFPVSMDMERRSCGASESRHRRDRLRPADRGQPRGRSRCELHLP